jgi:hypothetical protein
MSEELKSTLMNLPDQIAEVAKAILILQAETTSIEAKMAPIEVAVQSQVATDKVNYTNDTARKAGIKDLLSQNKDYEQYTISRDRVAENLELARIEYQRCRDSMNVLIAIAGMR